MMLKLKEEKMTPKEKLDVLISDVIANFLYYDRKEDENIPINYIEDNIKTNNLSVNDIVKTFKKELIKGLS